MRTIGVVTVGRSDYGLYLHALRLIHDDPGLELRLVVAGTHLSPAHGETVRAITADGFEIAARVDTLPDSDTPRAIAEASGRATAGFARALDELAPDILLLLGDRFEMHAAGVAAVPFLVPIAHVHGGESTQGAIDESFRHSLTKLAHLHFPALDKYARRIVRMGEEPWRVTVAGAPGLDSLLAVELLDDDSLAREHGVRLRGPTLLVTFHPVTLEYSDAGAQVGELAAALDESGLDAVLTFPNVDTGSSAVLTALRALAAKHPERFTLVANLGTRAYATLLRRAVAMVGNSSSGIIEAPSFGQPVVNVGTRQQGRVRAANVVDVGNRREEIAAGIERAASPAFRATLAELENPYGDGRASERIVARLRDVELGPRLLEKRFFDDPG